MNETSTYNTAVIHESPTLSEVLKPFASGRPAKRRRLAVICGRSPVPSESFIRRDLRLLEDDFEIKVFGLERRVPSFKNIGRILSHPLCSFPSLLLRLKTINEVADYVSGGGLILAHFAWTTADLATVAAEISKCKWVCCIHAWDVFRNIQASQLAERLRGAAAVIACTRAAADAAVAAGIGPERLRVVRHALDQAMISRVLSATRARCRLKVCAAGRLVPKKGFDILIEAWQFVLDEIPEARLEIIGDGPMARELKRRAAHFAGSVAFTGALDEEATLMRIAQAGLFVLPSRRMADGDRDGMSNAVLEAMALGVPVLTTNAGAAEEMVAPRDILSIPLTPAVLARAIVERLAEDEGVNQ